MSAPTVHLKASAALYPCALYRDHGSAVPIRTQGHHRKPAYLQRRVWGEVRDNELLWLCGTCHDSVHAWLDWLLAEAYQPPTPPLRVQAQAREVLGWYDAELAARDTSG